MKKVRIDQVNAGDVSAIDIFDPDIGGDFPLIACGVVLTNEIIAALQKRSINELLVQTPPGYKGKKGETFAPTQITEDILFDGAVELNCDIPASSKIEAVETILINGNISEGCSIISSTGEVIINGTIAGSQENPIKIACTEKILINSDCTEPITFAEIKTAGNVRINKDVDNSKISSKGKMVIKGKVCRSQLYSMTWIRINQCGSPDDNSPCTLTVRPHECRVLFQQLLQIDKSIKELNKEKSQLKNVIDLVRKLGTDVDSLSPEKKVELALQVKRFNQIKDEMASLQTDKVKIVGDVERYLAAKRVMIAGQIFPNVKVTIENCSYVQGHQAEAIAFCMENFKIIFVPL